MTRSQTITNSFTGADQPVKLSPSDLTFLWDECKRCFYLKYAHRINRPATPFPAIFGTIDHLMKEHFEGRPTSDLTAELPPGKVEFAERWVESTPIRTPGLAARCYIRGKFDSVIAFDDGSYGVVDFKTTEPKASHVEFYGRQLHAYAWALEHPADGAFSLNPISRLGLLSVSLSDLDASTPGRIAYSGGVTWMEIPHNDAAFLGFLGEVMALLSQEALPVPAEKCGFCQYREHARQHGM